ncbi:Clp protease [Nocardia sp. CDC159]|uniref:Clp protease n=1 Tax=Nocardia pulmonis TaxID=2951408 RepID=A0A9X2E851_9NOCA|nr:MULTISPECIES: Clp protease N-terminal domain-containing protein [Nocardia]MCM6774903.1 Clp protease [Nocardia pulmonis]MCM6789834.1 Clp protease [Nocardia sp. CDC159]
MFERFSKEARVAVVIAQEEARQLRSPTIDVEHVLLGITECRDRDLQKILADRGLTTDALRERLDRNRIGEPLGEEDAAALRSIGIDLDAVRESLEASFGEDALERAIPQEEDNRRSRFGFRGGMNFGHIPFTKDAKKVLELSLREALTRGDKSIEAGHILLGILRGPNPTTRDLIGGYEDARALREAVHSMLDAAA